MKEQKEWDNSLLVFFYSQFLICFMVVAGNGFQYNCEAKKLYYAECSAFSTQDPQE